MVFGVVLSIKLMLCHTGDVLALLALKMKLLRSLKNSVLFASQNGVTFNLQQHCNDDLTSS
jgi:uncharacterized protein YjhX (UPF0386 family)